MKVTLNIKDSFYTTFMDFLKHLPEVKVEDNSQTISQWQIDEVNGRINSTKRDEYLPLDEVKKKLTFKK
jgi:hypothetical protein